MSDGEDKNRKMHVTAWRQRVNKNTETRKMLYFMGWFCLVVVAIGIITWAHTERVRAHFFGAM
jgi:hypothetical protein